MAQNNPDPRIQPVIDECLPMLKALAKGRCAVTLGGSRGKRTSDQRSDVDFRVFCDEIVDGPKYWATPTWQRFVQAVERWRDQGIEIDYCWVRTIAEIDALLDAWLNGQGKPVEHVWTLWGYHPLTDIANQVVLDDPHGLIAAWQARLVPYPEALQRALLQKHLGSLKYWRTDYHYRNKVEQGDVVFLAGITARLVHDMLQVLFALNKTYYVGDGNNLHYVAHFWIQPSHFAERVTAILYPTSTAHVLTTQYEAILSLIDDIALLATQVQKTSNSVE
ncbi:MAG: DUF4037 domain-containing protein [Caldilineaceae bacterium]